jgi:CubicO group peptidase (beta-lactamase class C family)
MNKKIIYSMRLNMCVIVFLLVSVSFLSSQIPATKKDSLISFIADTNNAGKRRLEAMDQLSALKLDDTVTLTSFIHCFSDENPYLRGKAANSLSQIGKKAVPYLIKAIQAKNENVRWCAALSLSKIGRNASEAVPYLVESLNDNNDNIRWCSLIALGTMGNAASLYRSQISKHLYDRNEDIKWAAVYALTRINGKIFDSPPEYDFIKQTIENDVPSLMKELHVPGVSLCLIRKGKVVWSKSFGVKDARTLEPVNHETMFEACSMSKPVLAYAALKLADEKKLNLDKPLEYYLGENFISLADYRNILTARMVLCHTSGFPNWRMGDEETDGLLPLYFKPGTKFGYSGEGYYYLQRVIEKITGDPLNVFLKKTLFDRLGLKHINFIWMKEFDLDIASGHDTSGSFLQKTKYEYPNAAYSLYTSAENYAAFMCEILYPRAGEDLLLPETILSEMMSHQVEVNVREPISRPGRAMGVGVYWGLGWAIDSTISGNILYHSGANRSGFRCYSQYNYSDRTGLVIMTNGLNGSDLWRRLISKIGDF